MGYLPVTVSLAPTVSSPTGRGPITFDVVLSSQLQDAVHEGTVSWRLPPGWCVEPDTWAYRLEPDGMAELRARVTPAPDAAAGTYVVGARTTWAGDLVEDVAEVVLGTADDTPAERAGQVGGRALALEVVERELVLRAGDRAELGVVLRNHARDEISGELQLVSPWGTWEAFPDVVRAFGVPAGERRLVSFPVVVPADAEPGYAWAVVKAMWFGHRAYGSTVRLTITPG
jgi:hypothetical protein